MREHETSGAPNVIPFPTANVGGSATPAIFPQDWDDGRVIPNDITDDTTDIEEALFHTRRFRADVARNPYGTRPHAVAAIKLNWWTKELRNLVLAERPNIIAFPEMRA